MLQNGFYEAIIVLLPRSDKDSHPTPLTFMISTDQFYSWQWIQLSQIKGQQKKSCFTMLSNAANCPQLSNPQWLACFPIPQICATAKLEPDIKVQAIWTQHSLCTTLSAPLRKQRQ